MRTRRPAAEQLPADELFRSRLENQIDLRHPLVQLSHRLPWSALEQALSPRLPATTSTGGRPALPVRLIAGLLYLKHAYDLSDEAVCERWLENPYWQFFTGEVVFQTCLPCDPSSLTRWRQRLGEAGMEALLAHTINTAHAMKAVDTRELSRVIVDTTVQEKRSPIPPTAVCWRWRASWCCWPSATASHCDRAMRGKVRRCAASPDAMRMRASSSACARSCDANARSWGGYHAICNASWTSWNRRYVSASVSGWSAHTGCWQSAPRTNKTLRLARAGSGMHQQGQGKQPVRIWRQGRHCGECAQGLDCGRAQFSRSSLRRRYVGRATGTGARAAAGCGCDPAGGDCGSGVSRARRGGCADPASRPSQDADTTAMALDQTTASGRAGDRTSETGLPLESLPSQRRPGDALHVLGCAAGDNLRWLLRWIAFCVPGCRWCGRALNALKHHVAGKHGTGGLRGFSGATS